MMELDINKKGMEKKREMNSKKQFKKQKQKDKNIDLKKLIKR